MIKGEDYDPIKTDIWSAGVTLFTMLVGDLPFRDKKLRNLYDLIVNKEFTTPSYLSKECSNLLQKLLRKNPNSRIGFQEIFKHPWMQKFKPNIQSFEEKEIVKFF